MKTSRPFTFILHIISHNEHITDMTIMGMAYRTIEPNGIVEQISYTISQIILDRDDITDIASYIDIQQINNACCNFAQAMFADDTREGNNLQNFPVSNLFRPTLAN